MRLWAKLGVGLASITACALLATASLAAPGTTKTATEYGKTLPPIGFVRFCAENPKDCDAVGGSERLTSLTPDQWNLVYQVNTYVNGKIAPESDMELYGQAEYWTIPTTAGDCEDYLLLKKQELQKLGFPSSALLITVVLDEKKEGHAVLTVSTADGDFILDNRRNEVLPWDLTNYTFLKRQSHGNPKQWVSLARKKADTPDRLASK